MKIEVPFLEIERVLSKAIKQQNGSEAQGCFAKLKQWATEKAVDSVSISGITPDEMKISVGIVSTTLKIAKIENNDITLTTSNTIDALLKLFGSNIDGIIRRDGDNCIIIPLSTIPQTKEICEWVKINSIKFNDISVRIECMVDEPHLV